MFSLYVTMTLLASVAFAAEYGQLKYPGQTGHRRPPVSFGSKSSQVTPGLVQPVPPVKDHQESQAPVQQQIKEPIPSPTNPVIAAVQTKRYVEEVQYPNNYPPLEAQVVEIDSIAAPIQFVFRTLTGPLSFQQVHVPAPQQETQNVRSEELPQHLSHEVYKPVIQEVRQVIQPFRRVTQEVQPVVEEIRTIVSRGEKSDKPGHVSNEQALNYSRKPEQDVQPKSETLESF